MIEELNLLCFVFVRQEIYQLNHPPVCFLLIDESYGLQQALCCGLAKLNFMSLLLVNAYKTLCHVSFPALKLEAEALVLKVQALCVLKENNLIEI